MILTVPCSRLGEKKRVPEHLLDVLRGHDAVSSRKKLRLSLLGDGMPESVVDARDDEVPLAPALVAVCSDDRVLPLRLVSRLKHGQKLVSRPQPAAGKIAVRNPRAIDFEALGRWNPRRMEAEPPRQSVAVVLDGLRHAVEPPLLVARERTAQRRATADDHRAALREKTFNRRDVDVEVSVAERPEKNVRIACIQSRADFSRDAAEGFHPVSEGRLRE